MEVGVYCIPLRHRDRQGNAILGVVNVVFRSQLNGAGFRVLPDEPGDHWVFTRIVYEVTVDEPAPV